MNEKTLLILLLLLTKNKNSKLQTNTKFVKDYVNSLEVDPIYTLEKIHIAENISPYIPEEFSSSFDKAIMISKSLIKITELREFSNMETLQSQQSVDFSNNTERLKKIISVVLLAGFVIDFKNHRMSTKQMVMASLIAAISFVLSLVQFVRYPQGGGIALLSMLPVMLFALIYGRNKYEYG